MEYFTVGPPEMSMEMWIKRKSCLKVTEILDMAQTKVYENLVTYMKQLLERTFILLKNDMIQEML